MSVDVLCDWIGSVFQGEESVSGHRSSSLIWSSIVALVG